MDIFHLPQLIICHACFSKCITVGGEETWTCNHKYWECRKSPGFVNMRFEALWWQIQRVFMRCKVVLNAQAVLFDLIVVPFWRAGSIICRHNIYKHQIKRRSVYMMSLFLILKIFVIIFIWHYILFVLNKLRFIVRSIVKSLENTIYLVVENCIVTIEGPDDLVVFNFFWG